MSWNGYEQPRAPEPSPVWCWNSPEYDDAEQPSFASSSLSHPVFGELFHCETYKASETIRALGAPIKEFGIVVEGCLKSIRYSLNGNELCNAYFEKDDVFPELLYFTGNGAYTYNLVAVKKSTVAWLDTLHFELMLKTDARLMYRFIEARAEKPEPVVLPALPHDTGARGLLACLDGEDSAGRFRAAAFLSDDMGERAASFPFVPEPGSQEDGRAGVLPHPRSLAGSARPRRP